MTAKKFIPDNRQITINPKYALISVFDKTGIVDFAKSLIKLGFEIISTGGTAKTLIEAGIKIIPIEKVTKNPESFDGRMKTISFQIEGGILFDRSNKTHQKQAKDLGIIPIDMVVCNFYPFEQKNSIENIDIGGPTMVRAAAKNYKHVTVIVDPNDYIKVIKSLEDNKLNTLKKALAAKAFRLLTYYDSLVSRYLTEDVFPEKITIPGKKIMDLRYGENPHQKAAFYADPQIRSSLQFLKKHWGRDLSLVNITDINAGIESVRLFREPCSVVIKHNTPCGISLGNTISQALERAIDADTESAFGGIIVVNKPIDLACAKVVGPHIDIIAAPKIEKNAFEYLKSLRKSMGIYTFGNIPPVTSKYQIKWLEGGFVIQDADSDIDKSFKNWKVVTKEKPTKKQLEQMKIGWKFASRIKSNTVIVVDKNTPMTRGIGSGQTSRVKSTKIALADCGKYAKGAILVSDSFFPFDDSVKLAAEHGISAIVQQGGSINDQKVIDTADKLGVAMMFTGRRAFWH
ncbi:bifunctional phosphoribosylaminoimidazolecarboxamide formyltransferase/IMP cyclohydrolase [Candidatus Gottesmanbacteria bacterium]|nr:bifunctional phosphoribosylaminoimidazolecarboxamide formyltransferase/IMP cyclohydrolase [Candidatus Gottesmanbacteria bacterium]